MIVVCAEFESVAGPLSAPVPAAGGVNADETALFFSEVSVDSEEWSTGPAGFCFRGPFRASLEFEWLSAAGDTCGPGDFSVEAEGFGEILADTCEE